MTGLTELKIKKPPMMRFCDRLIDLMIKKESAWQYQTSSSGALGLEFFAVEQGRIYMKDPQAANGSFLYKSGGAGLAYGFRLPIIGKVNIPIKGYTGTAGVAPTFLPSTGKLLILESFAGDELTRSDITGLCLFLEIGVSAIVGASWYAMLLGMDPAYAVAMAVAAGACSSALPLAESKLLKSATSILITAGLNVSASSGAAAGVFGGLLY